MLRRPARPYLQNALIGATAVLFVGARVVTDGERDARGPAAGADAALVPSFARGASTTGYTAGNTARYVSATARSVAGPSDAVAGDVTTALGALAASVDRLSHPRALEDAFRSYFVYRAAHPGARVKPYLYFVDYGLPSTEPRGYLFDMAGLRVVEGPFPVAHGRGSAASRDGVPRRFSNAPGSESTSLGLYLAQELYAFRGKSGGRAYHSVGLRLAGLSGAFNSNARARGVVAHGAPYVTASKAGRSEGCPAVEPGRAERLLPKLAHGGLVFLFAPDPTWMARDPWLAGGQTAAAGA